MNAKNVYIYWLKSANRDFKSAKRLFKIKEYHWSLFMAHLAVEKLLKSYYSKYIDPEVPYKHGLVLLTKKCGLTLTEKQIEFLDELTTFNISCRYPDAKFRFYKKCTKTFTKNI
ncbi:MAG: HEPN domain-containing protein [Candidatus Hydrogenedentota bacterium]